MYISEIKSIKNYRNLTGLSIVFDPNVNFLIGENNLGKTNFLELIHCFFSVGKFQEGDFLSKLDPIEISIVIRYSDSEIGFFEDNFDVEDSHAITITGIQASVDDRLEYYLGSNCTQKLSVTLVRKINTLYYYAQRMPSKEVDFRKTNGSGKVLNYLIQSCLEGMSLEEKDMFRVDEMENVVSGINQNLAKLNTITGDTIQAYIDDNPEQILCRVLGLGDINGHDMSELGEGIQYAFNIILQIVENIYSIKSSRKHEKFEERLIVDEGRKYYPIILILDEPEVHQHPYRQRSLIKKITAIINNQNEDFIAFLKELFNIDGLVGQIIIATHSPNILLNDYSQFIRVFQKSSELMVISGQKIDFDEDLKMYKHLLHNFIYLKEAMFSRCVIFVEGDTEMGAIPVFAERLKIDIDNNGVGVIKLDGADGVIRCMELYEKFGIPSVAIIDKDKEADYSEVQNVFFTTERDYEEDVYSNFQLVDYLKCCKELDMLRAFIGVLKKRQYDFDEALFLDNPESVNIQIEDQARIMAERKEAELFALKRSKNAQKGAILAKYVTNIPDVFKTVLMRIEGREF